MATTKTASTKDGHYSVSYGTEGPRHDPYSFAEYVWQPLDESKPKVLLHIGLGEWLQIGDTRHNHAYPGQLSFEQEFALRVGKTPQAVEELVNRPVYSNCRGKKVTIELSVNDVRWILRGLSFARRCSKSRTFRKVIGRVHDTLGRKACESYGDHILFTSDASIGPDSGSESFGCDACGFSEDVSYY